MDEIQSGDRTILFDPNLTRTAYSAIPGGDAERCGCLYCLNFAAQRSSVYPSEFRSLLEQIGIDPQKEGEVYELAPEGTLRIYGCAPTSRLRHQLSLLARNVLARWFYFAGEIVKAGERNSSLDNFEFWFANAKQLPQPVADFGDKVAAVEFITKLPWVLTEKPDPA